MARTYREHGRRVTTKKSQKHEQYLQIKKEQRRGADYWFNKTQEYLKELSSRYGMAPEEVDKAYFGNVYAEVKKQVKFKGASEYAILEETASRFARDLFNDYESGIINVLSPAQAKNLSERYEKLTGTHINYNDIMLGRVDANLLIAQLQQVYEASGALIGAQQFIWGSL